LKLFLVALFSIIFSNTSNAEEIHSAVAIFGIKAFFILLPAILPLFFIFNEEKKLLKFIVCLGIHFGVGGIVGIPIHLFFAFTEASGVLELLTSGLMDIYITKFVWFSVSIYILKKYSNSIFLAIKEKINT
jgi:hypothetical protein